MTEPDDATWDAWENEIDPGVDTEVDPLATAFNIVMMMGLWLACVVGIGGIIMAFVTILNILNK